MRKWFIALALVATTGCATGGSFTLNKYPNPHTAEEPVTVILGDLMEEGFEPDCSVGAALGEAFGVERYEFLYEEYNQQGRAASALTLPYRYTLKIDGGPHQGQIMSVAVPRGFVTDAYSKPSWSAIATGDTKKALQGAIIHDWLYAVGVVGDDAERNLADRVLYDMLRELGAEGVTPTFTGFGVKFGGKEPYGRADELRFYNKCAYGQCSEKDAGQTPGILREPVLSLPDNAAWRSELRKATVCVAEQAVETALLD